LNSEEKELFQKFCAVLAKELIPYLNKCVQILFSSKSMGISKNASSVISLDIEKLSKPLLPMMPSNVAEPSAHTEYHGNIDSQTEDKTESDANLTSQSNSDDRLASAKQEAGEETEIQETRTQEEQSSIDDNLSSDHSHVPINDSS
jgi:hypothetical protein